MRMMDGCFENCLIKLRLQFCAFSSHFPQFKKKPKGFILIQELL